MTQSLPQPTQPLELSTALMQRHSAGASRSADRELLDAVIATGDERAFRELYRRHTPRVYAVVWRLAHGNAQDTEDIVQEAWLKAVQHAASFEWRSSFGSWLTGIAINRARDVFRRSRKVSMTSLVGSPEPTSAENTPGERVDLDRAIAALPLRYRAVLIMHDAEGWQHAEIAAALGITTGTSKSQLFKARRRIRSLLQADGDT